ANLALTIPAFSLLAGAAYVAFRWGTSKSLPGFSELQQAAAGMFKLDMKGFAEQHVGKDIALGKSQSWAFWGVMALGTAGLAGRVAYVAFQAIQATAGPLMQAAGPVGDTAIAASALVALAVVVAGT